MNINSETIADLEEIVALLKTNPRPVWVNAAAWILRDMANNLDKAAAAQNPLNDPEA